MGRNSGFIACHAALASHEVDCCLVPEEPFVLRGEGGVLQYIESKLDEKGSCVLVAAEGAGYDVYGNIDIGQLILTEIKDYFRQRNREVTTKYLDPYVFHMTSGAIFFFFFRGLTENIYADCCRLKKRHLILVFGCVGHIKSEPSQQPLMIISCVS